MKRSARGTSAAARICPALLILLLAACNGGKPPEPVPPKPVAIAPVPPAPAPAPAPTVQPAQPSAKQTADAELAARVREAIGAEPLIRGFAVDVTADDGKVALFGTVGTRSRRDKAGQIAAHVSGVKSVVNNLAIVAGS